MSDVNATIALITNMMVIDPKAPIAGTINGTFNVGL